MKLLPLVSFGPLNRESSGHLSLHLTLPGCVDGWMDGQTCPAIGPPSMLIIFWGLSILNESFIYLDPSFQSLLPQPAVAWRC